MIDKIISLLARLGKKLHNKKIEIYGVPKDLKFTLYNLYDHLKSGGIVKARFNGDGTIFEIYKED